MIEQYLYADYTLYVKASENGQIRGNFIKENNNTIIDFVTCRTDYLRIVNLLPEVQETLMGNKLMCINYTIEDRAIQAQIGEEKTAGPYCTEHYYQVESEAQGVDIFDALMNLNTALASKKKEVPLKKEKK